MDFQALENDSILLQPLQTVDYDRLFQAASDPAIWAQHPDSHRYQPAGFAVYFGKLMETDCPFLIIDKTYQSVIGATSYYQYDASKSQVAIGFTFLAKSYWGGTVNRLVKSLLIDYAFQYVDNIVFHVREKNFRSQAALAKLGAVKIDEYPAPADPSTIQYEYAISKANWQQG
ncbi:GNAT family N-acetyltransferase [Sphingobacterium oryzagri]|uniref:GNAT family N-acetyltransferase n=1 Tax=Sphingobacterium oryzagri TaxID=3025669 RepID=A0ABY7WL35_9SPHI|nr:GNAT family N-acetyltransferase [Sphingobacterium sp. KACC 22765]WDF70220.1 GNAT family N-acetyltransferase [Sphingobacterium sp. KACC 22765]